MTNEDNVLGDLSSVLDRLNGRLDAMEKGEMPPFMAEKKKDEEPKEESSSEEEKDDEKTEKGFSDVITADYLNWMENTLKSQGVDTGAARAHFDGISKANLGSTPEAIGDGADYFAGQVKGRAQEGGSRPRTPSAASTLAAAPWTRATSPPMT